jgi:hypothetical protein
MDDTTLFVGSVVIACLACGAIWLADTVGDWLKRRP